jgi:putative inorganic carbon (hco3(-)) transporter
MLVLVALFGICSSIAAGSLTDQTAFFGLLDRLGVVPFIGFALADRLYGTERDRMVLVTVLVGVGGYLGLTALFETIGANALVFPRYILDPVVGTHFGRARGPFVEAAANGLALFEAGVAALVGMRMFVHRVSRLAATAVVVLCALGVLFTLTRAAWVGAIAAAIVGCLLDARLRRRLAPVALGAGALALAGLLLVPNLSDRAADRADSELPVWDRLNSNSTAWAVIEAYPLFGIGWNNFPSVNASFARQADDIPLTGTRVSVHNVALSHLAELGVVGGGLWVAGVVMAAVAAWRGSARLPSHWRPAAAAIFVNWAVVGMLGPLGYAFPNLCVWLWLGLAAAPLARSRPLPGRQEEEPIFAGLVEEDLARVHDPESQLIHE